MRNPLTNKRYQQGVGLLEILIAVVLMSMGFLAAARMQVEGMRFSQSAYHQSQAYFLANDMIDRMRSNIPGVTAGYYSAESTSAGASDPGCDVIQCSPLGIARQDLYDWSTNLHSLEGFSGFVSALPGTAATPAAGQIEDLGNGIFAVVMSWSEVVGGNDQQENLRIQFALETQ